jgi:predicted nucleic acid-binding protein
VRANGVPQGDLVDTGAILALADPTDSWHAACCDVFTTQVRLPLVTTAAVLTEAFYFAVKQGFRRQVWSLVHSSMVVVPITNQELPALDTLMDRYADRPMDFADATLVRVAEREGLKTILTIDHADFETYRIGRNAKFRILPAR